MTTLRSGAARRCAALLATIVRPAALVFAVACGASVPRTAMVEGAVNPQPMEGTVAVVTTLTGRTCDDPVHCVQVESMRSVLFVGVPNSPVPRPMVANEQEALRTHKAFFDDLLGKRGYTRYVVRVNEGTATTGSRDGARAWTVVINHDALRRALESAGIVRRFGY